MADHLSGRQNVIHGVAPGELNKLLEAIASQFGIDWLTASNGNPVQTLWQRKDAQSTNELLQLGEAVVNLMAANPAWVAHQISEIKNGDIGRRSGAIFEMLGLNLFHGPNQRVEPAATNQPGYDGSIFFPDGSSLMLSIKNHGITSAELGFRAKAEETKDLFLEAAQKHRLQGFMRIGAISSPGAADWKALKEQMDGLVAQTTNPTDGVWSGWFRPIPPQFSPLSPEHLSYIFQIAAPYHANEQNNFLENIRKGISNLEKHHANVSEKVCRTLLLRLSATASVPKCVEWAKKYFGDLPDTQIELILLYQAVPAADLTAGATAITHYMAVVPGPNFAKWQAGSPTRRFVIRSLVGRVTGEPTGQVMTDGVTQVPIDGMYIFQRADIYRYYAAGSRPVNAILSSPSPGILIHAVIAGLPPLQMIAPPNAELLLLP
jgi:hypothetical protein